MNILLTGGSGRLGTELLKNKNHNINAPSHKLLDITQLTKLTKYLKLSKPDVLLHSAALTNPMDNHIKDPKLSILTNIIGTSNCAAACVQLGIKMIYISTDYVYPGKKGPYFEDDPLLPINNYGWSKLGGECSVKLIPNHLILRCSFTEKPFKHESAFIDSYKSFMYVDEIVKLIWSLIENNAQGTFNVGGSARSIYNFAKLSNPNVKKILREDVPGTPLDTTLYLGKLRTITHDFPF